MRAKFSDQDLTDYALNELEPADRLYIESLLAVSEECRNDVYKMIELAQVLEDGFERDGRGSEVLCLKPAQRADLTRPHFTGRYVAREIASLVGLAACVAFAIALLGRFQATGSDTTPSRVAAVSSQVSNRVSTTVSQVVQSPESVDMKAAFESLRKMVSDPNNWLPVSEGMPQPPELCTPPTFILESAQLTLGDMAP